MQQYTQTPDFYRAYICNQNYLQHYGVKGMKWGVRKAVERTGRRIGSVRDQRMQVKASKARARAIKKSRRGYSQKTYAKYKQQGMTHQEAIAAAKKDRRKKVAGIAVGAAALTLTALAAKKAYDSGFNLKGKSQAQVFEKRIANQATKAAKKEANFKFKNQAEYQRAKASAAETEWLKAGKKGDPRDFYKYVDEQTIKKYGKMLRK